VEQFDDVGIERVLRWATIERGTADLSDSLGPGVIAPSPPSRVYPSGAAVAGKVVLFRRRRPEEAEEAPSSFDVLFRNVVAGSIALVHCTPDIGAAFGSNLALQAAACRAQAILTDGTCRDSRLLQQVGIPVGSNGTVPTRPTGCRMTPTDTEDMFGVTWRVGDWLLRDADGVLRLDSELAQRTAGELAESAGAELEALLSSVSTRRR